VMKRRLEMEVVRGSSYRDSTPQHQQVPYLDLGEYSGTANGYRQKYTDSEDGQLIISVASYKISDVITVSLMGHLYI
jgi:hypothetical protein